MNALHALDHHSIWHCPLNNATGHLSYAVGPGQNGGAGSANLSSDPARWVSGVAAMIGLLGPVMEQYIITSRRFAVRLALQGGLKSFARGIEYDVASDSYKPTGDRELAPLFEAIFQGAPASNAGDAVLDYLTAWNQILWQVYPDYKPSGAGNLLGATVSVDQAFIMQMMLRQTQRRRAAAANDNDSAWREATFILLAGRAA